MDTSDAIDSIRKRAEEQKASKALTALIRTREQYFLADEDSESTRVEFFHRFPDAKVIQVYPWGVSLEPTELQRVPKPPIGYAYKGGAARLALGAALGFQTGYKRGRDLDLVRVGKNVDSIDHTIAEEIMKEDARHGNGVELIDNFETYFQTRDVTINEVLYCSDRVNASYAAIYDLHDKKIRCTSYALEQNEESRERISAKIIRFSSEKELAGDPPVLIELASSGPLSINSFLLHLDRALGQSGRLAELYCKNSTSLGTTPEHFQGALNISDISTHLESLPKKALKRFSNVAALINGAKGKKSNLPGRRRM